MHRKGSTNVGKDSGPFSRLVKDRKSTRLNSSHGYISYAVFCLKKKTKRSTSRRSSAPRNDSPNCHYHSSSHVAHPRTRPPHHSLLRSTRLLRLPLCFSTTPVS